MMKKLDITSILPCSVATLLTGLLRQTRSRHDDKLTQLYERGASKKRIRQYRARWLGWVLFMMAGGAHATCDHVFTLALNNSSVNNDLICDHGALTLDVYVLAEPANDTITEFKGVTLISSSLGTNHIIPLQQVRRGIHYTFTGSDATNRFEATWSSNGWINAAVTRNSAPTLLSFTTHTSNDTTTDLQPFSTVVVADVDGDDVAIGIAFTAANGTLTGSGITGSNGSYTVTKGTAADVQASLRGAVFTPTQNQVAVGSTVETTFTVTPSDAATGIANTATVVTVTSVNDAPVISGTPATSVDTGSDYSFIPVVTDIDAQETQTFTIVNKPDWATFNEATGELSGTPSDIHIGITSDIVITVTDAAGEKASLAPFSIEVEATIKAVDDMYEFSRSADNTYTLNVLDNDFTQTDSEITIAASSTSIGEVAIEPNQLVLTVDADFVGAVDISYSISNSKEEFSQASVSVVITGDTDSLNVIVAPDDVEVNATGLYTPVNLGVATATNQSGNPIAVNLVGNTLFTPGNHIAYWETAVEGDESNVTVSQQVVVHPLVSLGKDQVVVEGTTASVQVLLNGDAPVYPLNIPFEISGSVDADDYIIDVDSIDVESGRQAVITISIVDDGVAEGDETLTVTLGDVNKGNQFVHTMTITEGNIAPSIEVSLSQGDELRQVITPADGLVTINGAVSDINGDLITTQWDYGSEFIIEEETSQLVFDPSNLTPGTYSVSLSATDVNVNPLSSTKRIYFSVKETLAVLTTADTDGDLIPDNQEGYSDSDSDGIPDYLDGISECNVIPQQVDNQDAYLVEGDAGICLRLGNTLADGETGGVQLTESELAAVTGESDTTTNVGGIFDYIVTGLPVNGQDYHIVLPQRQPIPSNALYRKYNAAAGWTSFVEDADNQLHSAAGQAGYCPPPSSDLWTDGLTEGHWCVQLTIVDGGPNDDDGEANGTIVDPGGVAVTASDNTAPVAVNDSISVKAGESVIIDVLANDTDVDSDTLTLGVVTATLGMVTITSDNQIEYQTPTDFIGADVVTYTVSDGQGGTASATVNVDVIVNEAPLVVDIINAENQSKGGSIGGMMLFMLALVGFRAKARVRVSE